MCRVFFRKTFRHFCETEREKTAFCAIKRKSYFTQNRAIPRLHTFVWKNCVCAIPLFCNVHIINDTFQRNIVHTTNSIRLFYKCLKFSKNIHFFGAY